MKRIFVLIFTFLLLLACTQEYQPRNITKIKLIEFQRDSTSIRAIQALDTASVSYAGANGDISFTTDNGLNWSVLKVKYKDSIIPNFRSLGYNGTDYFALSIGNPALLYKVSEE